MAQATLSTLRNRLRAQRLNDISSRTWSDPELNGYISEAARDISRVAEPLMTDATVAVIAGVGLISTLPTDILRIFRTEWITADDRRTPLEFRDMNNMDAIWWDSQNRTQSRPVYYCTQGYPPALKIQLFPVPSDAGNLRVWYYKAAADLVADSDLVDIPEGWDDIALDYAEYLAFRRDDDDKWTSAKARYDEKLSQMVERTRRWVESAGMIQEGAPMLPAWIYGGY